MTDQPGGTPAECPAALRAIPGWLIWRYEPNDNPGGKPRKVPFYAGGGRRTGQQGTHSDTVQLVRFEEACAAATRRKMSGVGLALLPQFGITALDFDNVSPDHPDVLALIDGTYAEVSPSGKGIRAFFTGDLGNRKDHGGPFGFETFSSKGFVTFTGDALPFAGEVAPVTQTVLDYCASRFGREHSPANAVSAPPPAEADLDAIQEALDKLDPGMGYHDWLKVGMAIHHETAGQGFDIWDNWSQPAANYTSREFNWDRWRSFGRGDGQQVTIRSLMHLARVNSGPASPEEFEDAVAEAPAHEEKATAQDKARFEFMPITEFADRPAPKWIIKGVLPQAELCVLFGASGSGKSFMALDMAGAVAQGLPWRGRKVRQGRVAYIAAEGAGGFRNRAKAYLQHHKLEELGVSVLHTPPNLLEKKDSIDVAKAIKASGGADLVIVDTFAQVMPGGDENSGEDVGKALAHCKGIHRATGAMVVLVHHSGKDQSKGARGWSGLRAAADAELEVVRGAFGRTLRISKQKDGDDEMEWGFGLEVVQIGVDDDMEPITSCVVVEAEVRRVGPTRALGPVERVVNEVIQEFAMAQTAGIEIEEVLKEAAARMAEPEDGKRDTRKQRARQALKTLLSGDEPPYIEEDGCLTVC